MLFIAPNAPVVSNSSVALEWAKAHRFAGSSRHSCVVLDIFL